jgi:hypothetical protein
MRDPYDRYAGAVRSDAGASRATVAQVVTRLQSTVVHGHVPPDSARIWSATLTEASKELTQHADHLAQLGPPDATLARTHAALLTEIRREADTLNSIASSMSDPSVSANAFSRLMQGTQYTQDEIRWTEQRAARQLATHGIIL